MKFAHQNDVRTQLAESLTDSATQVLVLPAQSPFNDPALESGRVLRMTIVDDVQVPEKIEVVDVTDIDFDFGGAGEHRLTIERGKEGTAGQAFDQGAAIFVANTAEAIGSKQDADDTAADAVSAIKADEDWNAADWDMAFGWGDHGAVGYLTSETDPTVPTHVKGITETQIGNWDTAFGWGNHASAGYLTSDPSPPGGSDNQIQVKSGAGFAGIPVTWNGNRLNMGGVLALGVGDFGLGSNITGIDTDLNTEIPTQFGWRVAATDNNPTGLAGALINVRRSGTIAFQLYGEQAGDGLYVRGQTTGGGWTPWRRVWHSASLPVTVSGSDVGFGVTPTQRVDVDGKIRMRTQTADADANDIVVSKGFVGGRTLLASRWSNVTIGTGATNVTGMVVALEANAKYSLEIVSEFTPVGDPNTTVDFTVPSGTTMKTKSTHAIPTAIYDNAAGAAYGALASLSLVGMVETGGTAGNLQMRASRSGGTSQTFNRGYMKLTRLQ